MARIYLMTGASADLGITLLKLIDQECGKTGEQCIVYGQYYQNDKDLLQLSSQLNNICLHLFRCDLSDIDSIINLVAQLQEQNVVPTHILHLAASKFSYMKIKDFEWQAVRKELDLQVGSLAIILKSFLPLMSKKRYGKIVVMLTAYTLGVPPKYMSNYIISKYALWGLVKAAASEYAGKGININAVSPSMIETKFLSNLDPRVIEITAEKSAMRRNITLSEVASAIQYLLSDEAVYINGVNLNLSGGDYF